MVPPPGILALKRWQRSGLIMALWTVLGLIDAGQFYIHVNYFRSRSMNWEEAVASGLADWYVWALLAPFIFRLGRRFPLDAAHWRSRLLLYLAAGAGFVLLKIALDLPLAFLIHGQDALLGASIRDADTEKLMRFVASYVTVKSFTYFTIYAAIVGAAHLVDYYQKYRERELLASQLGERLAEARLLVLRMQLHPHFLFNTLNAISALIHTDVRLADRMIARLADLLRATLADPGSQEVSLGRELTFLTPYLEIEQTRLGDRLTATVDVPDELHAAKLPYLLLQPLVENAIRHGIAPRLGPGRLAVRARRRDDRLDLEVTDDGPGLPAGTAFTEGIGLSNTRARLRGLYGDDHTFALRSEPHGGLIVAISIPYREAEAESDAPVDNHSALDSSKTS
jgi:two-component system LytT family sensor kinase